MVKGIGIFDKTVKEWGGRAWWVDGGGLGPQKENIHARRWRKEDGDDEKMHGMKKQHGVDEKKTGWRNNMEMKKRRLDEETRWGEENKVGWRI